MDLGDGYPIVVLNAAGGGPITIALVEQIEPADGWRDPYLS